MHSWTQSSFQTLITYCKLLLEILTQCSWGCYGTIGIKSRKLLILVWITFFSLLISYLLRANGRRVYCLYSVSIHYISTVKSQKRVPRLRYLKIYAPILFFFKGERINIIAWDFHRTFFTQRGKVTEVFKKWCSVIFQLRNKMTGNLYCRKTKISG